MLPILNRMVVFPVIEIVRQEPISKCLVELNRSQWYNYDRLKELQWRKLKSLLNHCYSKVPYYTKLFNELHLQPEDIKSFDDFEKFPFLSKEIIRSNREEITYKKFSGKVEHGHSGGTMGKPLNFIRDSISSAYARASLYRGLGWYGIKRGEKQLRVWGLPLDEKQAKKERWKDLMINRKRVVPFDININTVYEYVKTIKKFRPSYMYGYPSSIQKMCQIMKSEKMDGRELNIKYVVSTAETLYPYQREYIESYLNCRVINEYGCSEAGPIAYECPEGNMHINMENVLIEFIENKNCGEVFVTNLNSYSMPFIRYKVGDTGKLRKEKCTCGRNLDMMSFDAGRVLGTLIAPDGHFVSGTIFCYITFDVIEKYGGIKDFKVLQKKRNLLEITLSKDINFSEKILDRFTSKIREVMGNEVKIDYNFVNDIPPEKSGKRLFVYSELPEAS